MHLRIRRVALCCAMMACRPAGVAAVAPDAPATEVRRTLIAHEPVPDRPGFESRVYLIEYPAAVAGKLHVHTEPCIGYVIEGRFESAFGDGPVTVKRAGEAFIDIPGKPHHFRNPDPQRPLRFVVGGTFREDEPLFRSLN
jgi:quercetin dioxygenase-like cupin family protein